MCFGWWLGDSCLSFILKSNIAVNLLKWISSCAELNKWDYVGLKAFSVLNTYDICNLYSKDLSAIFVMASNLINARSHSIPCSCGPGCSVSYDYFPSVVHHCLRLCFTELLLHCFLPSWQVIFQLRSIQHYLEIMMLYILF